MEDMKIRKAKQDDIEELADLYLDYFVDPGRLPPYTPPRNQRKKVTKFLVVNVHKHDSLFLVVQNDSKLIGFIYASIITPRLDANEGKQSWVNDIYIAPQYRRKGLATMFLRKAIAWAKSKNAVEIYIGTSVMNKASQALYPKLGFKEVRIDYSMKI